MLKLGLGQTSPNRFEFIRNKKFEFFTKDKKTVIVITFSLRTKFRPKFVDLSHLHRKINIASLIKASIVLIAIKYSYLQLFC